MEELIGEGGRKLSRIQEKKMEEIMEEEWRNISRILVR
jgi:hypothetical protein